MNTPQKMTTFDFNDGNVLKVKETGIGILVISSLTFTCASQAARQATAAPTSAPATAAPTGGSALSQVQIDAVVSKHNTLRGAIGASDMMMLTWSPVLASRAQAHSSTCPGSSHSSNRGYDGENMAASAGSNFQLTGTTDLTPSVQRWYDEISDAGDYQNGGTFNGFGPCTGVCGHFTQVVWAAANEIGCGVTSCPMQGMPGYQLTCQYRSTLPGKYGGNMGGSGIFTKGTACASCPSGYEECTEHPPGLCGGGTSGGKATTAVTMQAAPSSNGKKCGVWPSGLADRLFTLRDGAATESACKQNCLDNENCVAMSGIFGQWCMGCKTQLAADHEGAVAFKTV
jgi:hypothetical protein